MNIIDFENIHVSYDDKLILKELNLKIEDNQHWAILGANGSGKSTLIKLISSQIHPRQNYPHKKLILGKERYSLFDLRKAMGIITNDLHNYFYDQGNFLTAYEVVLSGYYSSIGIFEHQDFTQEQHDKANEILEYLEITDLRDKIVAKMSTGQLRKCIIGRALIHEPKAFILDEPTVGLDIKAQLNFIKLLRKLSQKANIILVTHHLEEIFEEISHVALIKDQTIFKQGKKEDILNSENISDTFGLKLKINSSNNRYFIEEV
ncbi:ABC transporter related protein [Arcobacter nitrofigilis DSM 7299]|uniref:ABC transporter related protein n=1 Tax=Arcobacter nitrofigilis (strain ATCC 33309 / DSM 7299 / CCUG 15893 / LMG 7604 / NCTC 12251 / CI) TaxID=572480 RepID=D5V228_ARCNC|nr:ATP-binding cassette domain-containing protein [Arcobacter nitrofigilis]ADG92261.1 ABC transporter related protein [Arcobacter nitrofigilis DSM 7299]